MEQKLTIGMAHHNDYHGVYFTIQDIRKELYYNRRFDLLNKIEFVVIENDPSSSHAKMVKNLQHKFSNLRVIDYTEKPGTSGTRNKIVEEARGNFVLVMDCHVLLCPVVDTLDRLFTFMEHNKNSEDLFCGPLIHDELGLISTHYDSTWSSQMWGQWSSGWQCVCENYKFSVKNENGKASYHDISTQEKIDKCVYCNRELPKDIAFAGHDRHLDGEGYSKVGQNPSEEPFDVFAQGLGCFFTRKNSWLGFNEHAVGFGGEECYIHEKYRKNGKRVINLPFLRWLHRFGRPEGVNYPLTLGNKVRNYILEFLELGLDLSPVRQHFVEDANLSQEDFNRIHRECLKLYNKDDSGVDQEVLQEIESLKIKLKSLQQKSKQNA